MIEQVTNFGESIVNRIRGFRSATEQRLRPVTRAREQSFREWSESNGFVADREPIDFSVWRFLRQVYDAVPRELASQDPNTFRLAKGYDETIMKGGQSGGSVKVLLLPLWLCLIDRYQGGYFLPTEEQSDKFSSNRFIRFCRENPEIHRQMGDPGAPGTARKAIDEGSVRTRRIGHSILYFLSIYGRISTESMPLDFVVFDEVQDMLPADVEKAMVRVDASSLKLSVKVSTANFPGSDIDYFYQRSDQREFHTECGCGDGVVLAREWHPIDGPACIGEGNGTTPGIPRGYFYRCPRCEKVITDPQKGLFRSHAPTSHKIGFQWPQMLSPKIDAGEIMDKWLNRVDTKNFFNRSLGLPYTDPNTQPITDEVLRRAEVAGMGKMLRWGPPTKGQYPDGVFMGCDQMGQNIHVTIGAVVDGRVRYLWLEIIYGKNTFKRCYALMKEFRVRFACMETLLNFDEAKRFADAFPGRVFLAQYQDLENELLTWWDRPRDNVKIRKTTEEEKVRYSVTLDQYKVMSRALGKWVQGEVEHPDSRTLRKDLQTTKGIEQVAVCKEFWKHLKAIALVTELREGKEDERRFRRAVKKVGIDPHFAYANMLMMVAMSRVYGTDQMLIPDSLVMWAPGEDGKGKEVSEPTNPPNPSPATVGAPTAAAAAPSPAPAAKSKPHRKGTDMEQVRNSSIGHLLPGGAMPVLVEPGAIMPGTEGPATCGTCVNKLKDNQCALRLFYVSANQPACDHYHPVTNTDEDFE